MSQQVYSSAQVAKLLGVSGGMLRRYALSYEELSGEKIHQHPRDGRQFTQQHLDILVSARRFVAGRQGLSVESGLRMALGMSDMPPAFQQSLEPSEEAMVTTQGFRDALEAYAGPLLTQLQTLNTTNERLVQEVVELRRELAERPRIASEVPEDSGKGESILTPLQGSQGPRGGLGERLGRRVDDLLRRFRGER